MMRKLGAWILLAFVAHPMGGAAQVSAWSVQTSRGWIGISVTYTTAWMGGDETTVAVIDEVVDESPAARAGVQAGDTLTHLDGRPISREVLATVGRSIEVGDLIRLTISRGGWPREILVEAAPEPPNRRILTPDAGQVVIHLDSVRGAILQNLDSLRLSIAGLKVDSSGDLSIRILRPQPEPPAEDAWLNLTYRIWGPGGDSIRMIPPEVLVFEPDLAVPFTAVVASTKETQELREQLKQVRSQLTESRREELAREREIRATTQGPVEEILRRDERMQEIREREAALVEEVNRLNAQLESASQSEMRRQFAEVQARREEAVANARRAREELSQRAWRQREDSAGVRERERERDLLEEYELQRPLSYIIAGQSFVAGAQLQTLNPDLASYFQVDRGVLVTEVLEGTPAEEAGLLSGDVITQVGGERVSSLNDLRFGIGYFERPLRLRVVRKGAPLEIVIR
jgi:membrane-associated protease RseP (regulator of RpoE activity)